MLIQFSLEVDEPFIVCCHYDGINNQSINIVIQECIFCKAKEMCCMYPVSSVGLMGGNWDIRLQIVKPLLYVAPKLKT